MTDPVRAEIIACETCGHARGDASGRAPGELLLEQLRAALAAGGAGAVDVSSVRCLWACQKSCAVVVRSPGRVGYVIAGLEPTDVSARALLDYATMYAESVEGAVPYKQWPAALKGHFLCRIPRAPDVEPTAKRSTPSATDHSLAAASSPEPTASGK